MGRKKPILRDNEQDDDEISLTGFFLAAKSKMFLVSAAGFLGSTGLWMTDPGHGSLLSLLQPYAPATMALAGSFTGGFLVGWFARRTFGKTIFITGLVIAAIGLLIKFGVGGSSLEGWAHASVGWVSESTEGAKRYLAALIPSAAASGTGFFKGFRGKKRK